ncbi:ABC transporter permease subunit [Paenibacillus sp. JTLBN-2024]
MPNLFDVGLVFTLIPQLLKYLPVTLELTAISMLAGLLLGLLLAIIRMKRIPVLVQLSTVFISFTRGTPILVQLYMSYAGIPLLLKYYNYYHDTGYNVNSIPSIFYVLLALSLNEAAYSSEVIRAALQSVDKGQIEAAQSLGMTYGQVLRRIILPEASRRGAADLRQRIDRTDEGHIAGVCVLGRGDDGAIQDPGREQSSFL